MQLFKITTNKFEVILETTHALELAETLRASGVAFEIAKETEGTKEPDYAEIASDRCWFGKAA